MKMSQFVYITGLFYREWWKFDEFDGILSLPEVISRVTKRSLSQATPVPGGKQPDAHPAKQQQQNRPAPVGSVMTGARLNRRMAGGHDMDRPQVEPTGHHARGNGGHQAISRSAQLLSAEAQAKEPRTPLKNHPGRSAGSKTQKSLLLRTSQPRRPGGEQFHWYSLCGGAGYLRPAVRESIPQAGPPKPPAKVFWPGLRSDPGRAS